MAENGERGQSSVVALVLILALALGTALLLAAVGSVTLQTSQQYAEAEKSVQTLSEFDSRASLVALGGGDGTTVRFGLRGERERVTVRDSGRLRMVLEGENSTELVDTSLGTVAYANGDRRTAYQGGGVWRRTAGANGSVMVSPPEVHYRRGTLTLPMVRVTSDEHELDVAQLAAGERTDVYPAGDSLTNPVPSGTTLVLYVTSDYYQGWASFFERRVGADATRFHHNRTVRVTLVSPESRLEIDSGLISVGTGSPIAMSGNANKPTFVDSYDSDAGPYDDTSGDDGTVRSPSGLNLGGESFIKGDVNTGGVLDFDGNNNTVFGHARHGGLGHNWQQSGTITEWEAENGSGVDIPPIDGPVNSRVSGICDGDSPSLSEAPRPVPAGEYCVDGDLTVKKETLTLDLADGNVSIAVTGDVTLQKNGTIRVTNANDTTAAKLWTAGDEVVVRDSQVTVEGDRSPAFRLYAGSGTSTAMQSQSTFTGLLYAPTTEEAGGGLSMQSQSHLYGSAVVGTVEMRSGSAVHYDHALEGFRFNRRSPPASRLSYLYVTINEVEVSDR